MSFLSELQKKRTQYTYASQARTQAQSLNLLSSGIYTEEERFIYELLQNAVDAFVDTPSKELDVKIEVKGNYLLFMHNGAAFTETDIEGLCDVGNGSKVTDTKKVGYKGIGFKSVFMKATQVFIKSASFCFKFDKEDCINYMPSYIRDGSLSIEDIPWQIIPIETEEPFKVEDKGYNVIIYIRISDPDSLVSKIDNLLQGVNFLLFLNARDVSITLYDDTNGLIRKVVRRESNGEVRLYIDEAVASRWLTKSYEVKITKEVKAHIAQNPTSVPLKLQQANSVDITFAISIDNSKDELKAIEDSVIYTFLPTSYSGLEVPFLINSNFITDAGRQQLHQDSEWNKLILREAPALYLKWIAELSHTYKSYFKVLPPQYAWYRNGLVKVFSDALKQAIKEIAFLPSLIDDSILKVSEAWIDHIGISDIIGDSTLIQYINDTEDTTFSKKGKLADNGIMILKDYGVFIFDKEELLALLHRPGIFSSFSFENNIKLINLLYDICEQGNNSKLTSKLANIPFILNEAKLHSVASDVFFPSPYRLDNKFVEDVQVMSQAIYDHYKGDEMHLGWLKSLGIKELNERAYIRKLYEDPSAVTIENAIEYGRLLYNYQQREGLFQDISPDLLHDFPLLTKGGKLKRAGSLFFGSIFQPNFDVEPYIKEDIFISEEYLNAGDSPESWKTFLKGIGVAEDISNTKVSISCDEAIQKSSLDREFFVNAIETSKLYSYHNSSSYRGWKKDSAGYRFSPRDINYTSYSFLDKIDNLDVSRIFFNKILASHYPSSINASIINISGKRGYFTDIIGTALLSKDDGCETDYFKWLIQNRPVIPTLNHTCEIATSVFSNAIPNIKELAANYLSIIDIDFPIGNEWATYLGLKVELELQDYLSILSKISQEEGIDNEIRIDSIYAKIIEHGWQNSTQIKLWGRENKILSSRKGIYLPPSELSHITIEGLKSDGQAYAGTISETNSKGMTTLLKTLGVRVIDSVSPILEGKRTASELKELLYNKLQYIASLKKDTDKTSSYIECKESISVKIEDSDFYSCDRIQLSYGDDEIADRSTFADDRIFCYVGELKPSKVEPLLTPLCRYLGIQDYEKELFVLLITNSHSELVEYLQSKGFQIDQLATPDSEGLEEEESIEIGTSSEVLSQSRMYEAQLEAQQALMKKRPDWTYPEGYGECGEDGKPLHYSTISVADENGDEMPIVLKSYRNQTAKFKVNPQEWESVVQNDAKLLVYTRINDDLDIVEIPQGDLIMNQSNISITFNSENLDKDEHMDRVSAFAETLHYFKSLHFEFDRFSIAKDAKKVRDIHAKKQGVQAPTTDEDL